MYEALSFVNLNCLNCGANLKISENIFEFTCQYCGASQIVERAGGIIALKYLSDRIERVQHSVDNTAAELKIQRLTRELEELEERHANLDEADRQLRSMINPIVIALLFIIAAPFLVAAAYTGSIIPLLIGGVVDFIVFWLWRLYVERLDREFESASNPMIKRGIEIKRKIAELETIIEQ